RGHDAARLHEVNTASIDLLHALRERYRGELDTVVVSGMLGPRGDGYRPDTDMTPDEAADYHRPQLAAFAESGADLAGALTLTSIDEARGMVRAARAVGIPIGISFTVETDGRLPDGTSVADAIGSVDQTDPPDHYLLNCAHPTHIARGLGDPDERIERVIGIRGNASTLSHAELDEADELDAGDPDAFAADHEALRARLPGLSVFGGCCGTDARHIAALWRALSRSRA
ncbi:MAG: homocysteine S-methyltransferase family protein, partial [Williamsia herbipolensis]|nr:homocysteine S-methyltransferase family protein [Williamsia herbipolensis]